MSLDVYLTTQKCPCCGRRGEVYQANITHNLGKMAEVAGIYKWLWRPEEMGVTAAVELVEPLARAVQEMKEDPELFKKHDSPNGWGTYEDFVPWIERYIAACEQYPNAFVTVSR